MLFQKDPNTSGKEHYRLVYQNDLEAEAEWLRRGAIEKVNSIEILLKQNGIEPTTLVELGCGTGAVITECQRRKLAREYFAIDYSDEAVNYLRQHSSNIKLIATDITLPGALIGKFDVIVLSHVIEHLENPKNFLRSVNSVDFSYLLIEVPLENLLGGRLKSLVGDRRKNAAGHVQFFTATSLKDLLLSSNLTIIGTRRYVPILDQDTIRFLCRKNDWGKRKRTIMSIARLLQTLLRPLWSGLYYAHYAALCQKKV